MYDKILSSQPMKMTVYQDMVDLLKVQLNLAQAQNRELNARIDRLIEQNRELTAQLETLNHSISEKQEEARRLKNKNKGLSSLLGNKSEKQIPLAKEEPLSLIPLIKQTPKERGNNNSKRKEYLTFKTETIELYPNDPGFDLTKAREIGVVESVRYSYVPGYVKKTIYRQHNFSFNDTVFSSHAPRTPLLNSGFEGSFIAGILQLRYIYSMPVERIIKLFSEQGMDINKATMHGLISKSVNLLDRLQESLKKAIKSDPYLCVDETYHNVLVSQKNKNGKGIRKSYFWGVLANHLRLVHFIYEDGSRATRVITDYMADYRGAIQSDAYPAYKNFESDTDYPDIIRIGCLQHCKRKFLDIQEDPDAARIVDIMNELYQAEHKHQLGANGWSLEKHHRYRLKYAPPIFKKLKKELLRIQKQKDLLPTSALAQAVNYTLKEFDPVSNYILQPFYAPDNNNLERLNRYISLSRRNSLFCGSHAGAKRMALLYSLACSCRLNNINTFEYFSDILNRIGQLNPNTPEEIYRDLLPDKWKKPQ